MNGSSSSHSTGPNAFYTRFNQPLHETLLYIPGVFFPRGIACEGTPYHPALQIINSNHSLGVLNRIVHLFEAVGRQMLTSGSNLGSSGPVEAVMSERSLVQQRMLTTYENSVFTVPQVHTLVIALANARLVWLHFATAQNNGHPLDQATHDHFVHQEYAQIGIRPVPGAQPHIAVIHKIIDLHFRLQGSNLATLLPRETPSEPNSPHWFLPLPEGFEHVFSSPTLAREPEEPWQSTSDSAGQPKDETAGVEPGTSKEADPQKKSAKRQRKSVPKSIETGQEADPQKKSAKGKEKEVLESIETDQDNESSRWTERNFQQDWNNRADWAGYEWF